MTDSHTFKLAIAISMFFALNSGWAATVRINTLAPETAKTLSFLFSQRDRGGIEDWDCEARVSDRSGTADFSRCKGDDRIACYEEIKETCRERSSGRELSRSYRHFTGVCARNYPECW